jgi:predicted PurR-regulated permease PerM
VEERRTVSGQDDAGEQSRLPRWYVKGVWYAIFAVALSICAWYVASQLTDLMITVAICFFLAFAIEPTVNRLSARGWKRSRATLLIYGVAFLVIAGFIALFGNMLVSQVVNLAKEVPTLYDTIRDLVDSSFGITLPEPSTLISEYWDVALETIANSVLGIVDSFLAFIFGSLTVLLVTFYLVADGPRFRRSVCSLFPQARQREVLAVWEVAIDKTSSYLVSRSILAVICGTAMTVFLFIIRVDNALVLGAFTGIVSAFVPTIGTYLGGLLPIVLAFAQSPLQGAGTLAFILAYQQIENLTIEPRVSARAMELNTAVSFLSVLAGSAILGPIGALLALPLAATVKAFVGTYLHRTEVVDDALTTIET